MTGDNVTERQWDDPLDFKKEGIVLDYKTAGVDIDAGNKFVEELKNKVPNTVGKVIIRLLRKNLPIFPPSKTAV